jgi:hypothetical protein
MRAAENLTFTLAAVFLSISSTAASAEVGPKDCTAELAKAQTDILDFYPVAAKSAAVAGTATLSCHGDMRDSGKDCLLVSEKPADQGFGKAALDIAAAATHESSKNTKSDSQYPPYTVTLEFKPSPLSITPNLLASSIRGRPMWASAPDERDLVAAMRSSGLSSLNAEAGATIRCLIANDGHLTECKVTSRFPSDARVERGALAMSHYFKMALTTSTGCPPGGASITIPIRLHAAR